MLKQTRISFKKTAKVQIFLMSIWLICIDDMDVPRTSVKFVGYLILDIGYSILENFLSPDPHERSLSVMRYGLTNDTVF